MDKEMSYIFILCPRNIVYVLKSDVVLDGVRI